MTLGSISSLDSLLELGKRHGIVSVIVIYFVISIFNLTADVAEIKVELAHKASREDVLLLDARLGAYLDSRFGNMQLDVPPSVQDATFVASLKSF